MSCVRKIDEDQGSSKAFACPHCHGPLNCDFNGAWDIFIKSRCTGDSYSSHSNGLNGSNETLSCRKEVSLPIVISTPEIRCFLPEITRKRRSRNI
mmetsp:Transcript_18806/g.60018  ORF Transcript_18806/g.60018 Transcript_18806/m.60018 type:complete len:95 (+) Transcript_18806:840-1124(+)